MKSLLLSLLLLGFSTQLQAQCTGKSQALEALGGAGGMLLYNTYLVIGEAADAYTKEVYDATEVERIVNEQIGGIETVQKQFDALLSSKFLNDPTDQGFVEDLQDAFDLVLNEGQALVDYVQSESEQDAEEFEAARKTAWAKVSTLLGFED